MEEKVTKYSTGVCQFCGQSIALAAEHDTQEEANKVATLACKCEEGKPFRRMGVTAKIKPKDAYVSVSRAEKREHQKTL